MDRQTRSDSGGDSSDSSAASSSSSDTVLIAKPLDQKHRQQLQAQLQQQAAHASRAPAPSPAVAAAAPPVAVPPAKTDLLCLVCERDDRARTDLLLCSGPCVSAFHAACLGVDAPPPASAAAAAWKCPSCASHTHACFHCKRAGPSAAAADGAESSTGAAAVRKCRALSCGKFYHSDCIAKLPLARIAGSHFICPSGAKKESVRCVRCPVAYHTSCLPKNCTRSFPGKRIICPKHEPPESEERDEIATKGRESAPSEDTARVKIEGRSDGKTEAREASSSSAKKLSKSAKREKKKKKKKRKKAAKRESKERGGWDLEEEDDGGDDGDGGDGDAATETAARSSEAAVKTEGSDGENDADSGTLAAGLTLKREDSFTLPALHIANPEAVSPATSSSLFESPATTNERIKARLVEALGQSDDDVESVGSPIPLPKFKVVRVSSDGAGSSGIGSPAKTVKSAEAASSVDDDADDAVGERDPRSPVSPVEKKLSSSAAGNDEVADSANDGANNSQSSEEKPRPSKAERKARHERSTLSKNLSREFKDAATAADRRSSKKQQSQGFGDLMLQVPGSPAVSGVRGVGGSAAHHRVAKDRISEGEEGDDEGPGDSSTPTLRRRTASGTPRGGEATADGTKAKASSSSRPSKKKKKKTKSSSDGPSDAAGAEHLDADDASFAHEKDANDAKWVQCDSCKKWRTVPKAIDLNAMPERWYCEMNTWDTAFASCAVDEEGAVEAAATKQKSSSHSKKSKSRSKSVKAPADPVMPTGGAAAVASDGGVSSPSSGPGSYSSKVTAAPETAEDGGASGGKSGSKKPDKQSKKRKLKLKLKEKYREVKWVQCESAQCGKWRVVPSSIDFSLLPAVWYCQLNSWAPELAKCSAANPPEVEAFLLKSHSKKSAPPPSSSSGSRPSKKVKVSSEPAGSTPDGAASAASTALTLAGLAGDVSAKPSKSAKTPKGGGNPPAAVSAQSCAVAASVAPDSLHGAPGSSGSTTSAGVLVGSGSSAAVEPPLSSSSILSAASKSRKALKPMDGIKKTVLEWAQCEKCNKWRKLPQHIKSSTLPDKWFCSMNHWDPVRASCSVPEEVDQEPLGASPLPSSQNWYPMPGHIGAAAHGGRTKRSKLSYSDLLYAGTGQLRKTYTSASSTLSFEYNGRVYHRDDQYKDSSMYVCPRELLASAKGQLQAAAATGGSGSSASESLDAGDAPLAVSAPNEPSVEQAATLVLDAMDVRHSSTIADIFRATNEKPERDVGLSLSLVTAAVTHLVQKGLVEKQESGSEADGDSDKTRHAARVGTKRRRPSDALFVPPTERLLHFRKVPKRPLKASKCWKLGPAAFQFPLKD
ncbi:hypothetical protein PybrP1_001481 [[Pythium] brassicae (nom. inval.)]|nr:hypothetical protein PybrP1_001481 [[Pythium] brassicae (nom. inval.)]